MDSSESPTHGDQEGSAYNGHFGCTCYHPLFCFNQFGDLERCALRPGNVHSADGWREVLEPVIDRYRDRKLRRSFHADAAFAKPEIYEFLEAQGSDAWLYFRLAKVPSNRLAPSHLREMVHACSIVASRVGVAGYKSMRSSHGTWTPWPDPLNTQRGEEKERR